MGPNRYSLGEVQALLGLYQALFPVRSAQWCRLKDYWDFPRIRPLSCLTTNFHEVTGEQGFGLFTGFDLPTWEGRVPLSTLLRPPGQVADTEGQASAFVTDAAHPLNAKRFRNASSTLRQLVA